MTILAIDTTTQWCSVAIFMDRHTYYSRHENLGNSSSKNIFGFIQDVLDQANIDLQDVDVFAVAQGPGAFTGIRLGIGVSQGMAFAQNKPLIPITTLDGMVAYEYLHNSSIFGQGTLTVAMDARMNQLYCAQYLTTTTGLPIRQGPIYLQNNVGINTSTSKVLLAYEYESYTAFTEDFSTIVSGTPNALGIAYQASFIDIPASFDPEDCQPLYIRDKVAQTTQERSSLNQR